MILRCAPLMLLAVAGMAADIKPQIAPPAPSGAPVSVPITMPPAPKTISTLRLIEVDSTGPTAAGQKILDEMLADGWRSIGISTVSAAEKIPATIAVLFSKPAPREGATQVPPPQVQHPAPIKP